MLESRNPFRFSEPVPPAELLNRERETRLLLRHAAEGNNSRLAAPRRYGKTSLLGRVVADARRQGWAAVYVDFFGVLTLDDVARRIERAYAEQLEGTQASWFAGVRRMLKPTLRIGGGPVPASVEVELDPQAEAPLLERLALPARLHERDGTRTLVVFDEFQDILAVKERADAVIRSEIQHHGDAASYVFAGSHVGMMRELFADRRRAFYGQAGPVDLPPLPADEVAEDLSARFEAGGRRIGAALGPLLDAAGGHPQRTMLLAHVLWELTDEGEEVDEEILALRLRRDHAPRARRAARRLDRAAGLSAPGADRGRRWPRRALRRRPSPGRLARRRGARRDRGAARPRRDRRGPGECDRLAPRRPAARGLGP